MDQRYNLGIKYAMDGKFEKAQGEFQKALKLDSSYRPAQESLKVVNDVIGRKLSGDSAVYFFKGIEYSNQRNFDGVVSLMNRAISIEPTFANAYYERGLAYAYQGDYDLAIKDFSKTIQLHSEDAPAFNNRGLAYAKGKKQYDEAFSDFNKAIEIDPDFAEAYENRGIAYRIRYNDKEKACADWKRACELGRCGSYEVARQNNYCN